MANASLFYGAVLWTRSIAAVLWIGFSFVLVGPPHPSIEHVIGRVGRCGRIAK